MSMTIRASYLKDGISHPVSDQDNDNLNVGSGTVAYILAQLGYDLPDGDGDFTAPIDELLERGRRWSETNPQSKLDAIQRAIDAAVEGEQHFFNPQDPSLILLKTKRLIDIAASGKASGATLIEAF